MAEEGACPGPCNAHYRKVQEAFRRELAAYDPLDPHQARPQPPDVRPWYGEPVWCGVCAAKIRQRLGDLDDVACILARYADGHRDAPDGPLVNRSAAAPSPSEAGDMADDVARMLGGWEKAFRDLNGWKAARREGDLASWITVCSAWLMGHLTAILHSAISEDVGKEILAWHREIDGRANWELRRVKKPLRCKMPSCQQLTLVWVEGEDKVCCSNPDCRAVMTYAEYEALVEERSGTRKDTAAA